MSQRYAQLLQEWREASDAARQAQHRVGEKFDRHLHGGGPAPTDEEINRLAELRRIEHQRLQIALDYVKATALGPATGHGPLE